MSVIGYDFLRHSDYCILRNLPLSCPPCFFLNIGGGKGATITEPVREVTSEL
jgi:hypothetical protein